jgi:ATP-dependent RNA helicase DHX8/PRP22
VIKYMTDDKLLREIPVDDQLSSYSVIMLDEAASRTHDPHRPLFGIPKKVLTYQRPDLKLIVTSAALDAEKSADYFFGCSFLSIPGRVHHVEIFYSREPVTEYFGKLRCAQCL